MQQQPAAADVALAPVLRSPAAPARVVVAVPAAAYAELATGGLLAVVTAEAVRVPGAVVVAGGLPALRPGDALLVGGDAVVAGEVRLAVARWWDSAVPPLNPAAPLPAPLPPAASRTLPDAVRAGADALAEALLGGADPGPAVRALVGLGPGLTPAGDDVVAAALVALVAAGARDRAAAVAGAVRPCLPRTTTVSAALLEHAAAGRAVPQLARHLRAPGDAARLAGLLAVGGTSGAALALGARTGLSVAAATMASSRAREVA